MAGGFSVLDNLNKNSKKNINDTVKACFRTKNIQISNIRRNDRNFYEIKDIEKLADEIQMVGLLENLTVVYSPDEASNTEYKLIGGERRLQALKLLVEKGFEEFNTVTCNVRNEASVEEEMVDLIICNSQRKKSTYELLEEEKNLKEALQKLKESKGTIKGIDVSKGKLRDIISNILSLSRTKVAQIENINNNLIEPFKQELKDEKITFSLANEIAGLDIEDQHYIYEERYKIGFKLNVDNIKSFKENKESEQIKDDEAAEELEGQISIEEKVDNSVYYELQNNYLNLGISFFEYQKISNLIKEAEENTILYLEQFDIDVDTSKLENFETTRKETNRILNELYLYLKDLDTEDQKYILKNFINFSDDIDKEIKRTDKQIESKYIITHEEIEQTKKEETERKAIISEVSEADKKEMIDKFINFFELENDLFIKRHNIEWLIEDLRCIEKMDPLKKDVFNRLAIALYTPKNGEKTPRLVRPILNQFMERLRFEEERKRWIYICDLLGLSKDVYYEKIPRATTQKEKMVNELYLAKINHYNYIGIAIHTEGEEKSEIVVNHYKNIDKKIDEYIKNYNDDLTLKGNKNISIVKVGFAETAKKLIETLEENKNKVYNRR